MANLNKVHLIGRLTRDPEKRKTKGGTKLIEFGFAVNGRKKGDNGEYEDKPIFLDCAAFNRTNYELASIMAEHLGKGSQVYIEGHLDFEQWEDKEGGKRSKVKVIVDSFQFLDAKKEANGDSWEGDGRRQPEKGQRRQAREESKDDGVPWE